MAAQYMPKTLAKTLSYIACHSPGEYGLFWDPGGTMPWKELYWALQEDPSLRFVRESHLREIAYLGIEIPFTLDGALLRLKSEASIPAYPPAPEPPERLYYACRRKQYSSVLTSGLSALSRKYLPLAKNRETALRIGRRRDPEPLLLEVLTAKAQAEGIAFRDAGGELYLTESLPVASLVFPVVREGEKEKWASRKKKEKPAAGSEASKTPGSFFMDPRQIQENAQAGAAQGREKKKGGRGHDWKREGRKERRKRSL